MVFELEPETPKSKRECLETTLESIDKTRTDLSTLLREYSYSPIIQIRMKRAEGWLAQVRSVVFDALDLLKRYGQ